MGRDRLVGGEAIRKQVHHLMAKIHLTRQSSQEFGLLPFFELLQGSCILSAGTASTQDSRHGNVRVCACARCVCVRAVRA
eukprot:955663-Pelagomonas_calceolata.AAC.1